MKVSSLPNIITCNDLEELYVIQKKSVAQIAVKLKCSQNKVSYHLNKCEIPKRSISEAMYEYRNPDGDPFFLSEPKTLEEGILFGIGLALYWGEGTKRGNGGVRLSNSDPKLMKKFIEFLERFFKIDKNRLKFSIQIPKNVSAKESLKYWSKELGIDKKYFYKPQIVKVRGKGTYKYKTSYGTTILNFNNVKLKRIICNMIENIE